jgi:hypothetical protein
MPSEIQLGATMQPAGAMFLWRRELAAYPDTVASRGHLLLVFVCTVALYYELYVGGGVAPLLLGDLRIPFSDFVFILAFGNLAGAFASLFAGLTDRMGRANLVVAGLGVVGLLTFAVIPNVHDQFGYAFAYGAVAFVEGIILVATPALIRDFSPQVGRATALGFWAASAVAGSFMVSMTAGYTLPLYRTWQREWKKAGLTIGFRRCWAFIGAGGEWKKADLLGGEWENCRRFQAAVQDSCANGRHAMSALRRPSHPLLLCHARIGDLIDASFCPGARDRQFGPISLAVVDKRVGIVCEIPAEVVAVPEHPRNRWPERLSIHIRDLGRQTTHPKQFIPRLAVITVPDQMTKALDPQCTISSPAWCRGRST